MENDSFPDYEEIKDKSFKDFLHESLTYFEIIIRQDGDNINNNQTNSLLKSLIQYFSNEEIIILFSNYDAYDKKLQLQSF